MIDNTSLLEKRVEQLRKETTFHLGIIQKSIIPSYGDIKLYGKMYYTFENHEYQTQDINTQVYLAYNLPYTLNARQSTYIDSMINLITKEEIRPFMIFIQNRFIKWSDITVVKDRNYSYLIINNVTDYKNYNVTGSIMLNCKIKYGENNSINPALIHFYFDSDGLLTEDPTKVASRIELIDNRIYGNTTIFTDSNTKLIVVDTDKLLTKDNILLFKNGVPYKDGLSYIEEKGNNIFSYDNVALSGVTAKIIYCKLESTNNNILSKLNRDQIYIDIQDEMAGQEPHYLDTARTPFNFVYQADLGHSKNFSNALDYIMKYNSSLFNDIYKSNSKINSVTYTGTEILAMCKNGYLNLFRRTKDLKYNTYLIMFKNHKLFENYNTIAYTANIATIYIGNKIVSTDIIEILFFYDVNNEAVSTTIIENNPTYLCDLYSAENMELYSTEAEDPVFNLYTETNFIQYKVEYTYTKNSDNNINITLNNPWYYSRKLTMVSNKQFRYCYNIVNEGDIDIILSPEFRYCQDIERYLIFINGQKLDPDQYRLTKMDEALPFNSLSIFTTITMHQGDIIEAFYIPEVFRNVVVMGEIPNTGVIEINMDKLAYNFSKDLHFIFINGLKIHPNDIIDIGRNKIRLINDIGSVNNLTIIEHIDPITILADIFVTSTDLWTEFINSLTDIELAKLIDNTTITSSLDDIKAGNITDKAVVYEIINTYYRVDGIINTTNNQILYAYDDNVIDENDYDADGNFIIRAADSTQSV